MLKNRKRLDGRGFTIIEVLIVLAVAALILLIVFLAVPALQRNSRNTSRNQDAATALAAMNEYYANNNAFPSGCSYSAPDVSYTGGTNSSSRVGYFTGGCNGVATAVVIPASPTTQSVYYFGAAPATTATLNSATQANNNIMVVAGQTVCTGGTTMTATGASNRNAAVMFGYESSPGNYTAKCISN